MKEKLLIIKEQLEHLTKSINEYLESTAQEEIIIKPETFQKIKYLGITNHGVRVFDYDNGAIFILSSTYVYQNDKYEKLLSGNLERLILRKIDVPEVWGKWSVNYVLESEVETKLRELYRSQS